MVLQQYYIQYKTIYTNNQKVEHTNKTRAATAEYASYSENNLVCALSKVSRYLICMSIYLYTSHLNLPSISTYVVLLRN